MDSKKIGNFGEEIACNYLKKNGYKILERNYFKSWSAARKGEIDIIAEPNRSFFDILFKRKKNVIHFVEVKTLKEPALIPPEEKVNFRKKKKLIALAQMWLSENKIPINSRWQIDIIAIKVDLETKRAKIRHFKNAVPFFY